MLCPRGFIMASLIRFEMCSIWHTILNGVKRKQYEPLHIIWYEGGHYSKILLQCFQPTVLQSTKPSLTFVFLTLQWRKWTLHSSWVQKTSKKSMVVNYLTRQITLCLLVWRESGARLRWTRPSHWDTKSEICVIGLCLSPSLVSTSSLCFLLDLAIFSHEKSYQYCG